MLVVTDLTCVFGWQNNWLCWSWQILTTSGEFFVAMIIDMVGHGSFGQLSRILGTTTGPFGHGSLDKFVTIGHVICGLLSGELDYMWHFACSLRSWESDTMDFTMLHPNLSLTLDSIMQSPILFKQA